MQTRRLPKISRRLISEDVLSSLRPAILEGTFGPGQQLVEAELAEQLGTSRVPVREALKRLAEEGLVELLPFRGAYVASLSVKDVEEIYALRCLLEGHAIRLAAEHATGDDLQGLRKIQDEIQALAAAGDVSAIVEKDFEFHRELCRLSGNKRLLEVWSVLDSQTRLVMILADEVFTEPSKILETHRRVLDALSNRDPDAAERTITSTLRDVAKIIVNGMKAKQESPSDEMQADDGGGAVS